MKQNAKHIIPFLCLMFFSLVLSAQGRKINFNYEIGGSTYNGAVKLLGVNEVTTPSNRIPTNLKPGGKWNLSCPSDAEYCGLMLGFSNLTLDNPNHHAKIYFDTYSDLIGLDLDSRSGDHKALATGNNQAILAFGITELNQKGQIAFKMQISGDGTMVPALSKSGNEVIFLQNYSISAGPARGGNGGSVATTPVQEPIRQPIQKPVQQAEKQEVTTSSDDTNAEPRQTVASDLSEDELWNKAAESGKIVDYTEYIRAYPMGGKVIAAREKIDSLKWNVASVYGKGKFAVNKKIKKYEDYITENETGKFRAQACQEMDALQWETAQTSNDYAQYLKDLAAIKTNCPDYVSQNINAEQIALKAQKTCEGTDCTVKFENHIGPLKETEFAVDSGVEVGTITANEIAFKIGDPKSKYTVNYTGPLGRTVTFILGLEDYFNLTYTLDKQNKQVSLADIRGGAPPYFLQIKSNDFFKQVPLGEGPNAEVALGEVKDLPEKGIQLYLTDAEKKIEKHIANVDLASSFMKSQLFFLLLLVLAFAGIGVLFYFKHKANQRKAAEWDYE